MSEFLTPDEVDKWVAYTDHSDLNGSERYAATLREMAAIVEAVANDDPVSRSGSWYPYCLWCDATGEFGPLEHRPSCLWARARKLRGKP